MGVERGVDDHAYHGDSAPSDECPVWRRRVLIERYSDLVNLAATLNKASVLAIDAEFAPVRVREPADLGAGWPCSNWRLIATMRNLTS